ncbi:MAG: hypothetical protein H8E41_13160 [Desulfobulbaceae bacterium]|uniref:Uncharacterized protein n=1 Tax=Candidatus Desulfobia pelagia TaxID=2841692 RepID=A0A8J6TGJ9_9BACT|nr:hypothetical protein [Candidatus Desulfobia pelagia]
MLEVKQCTLYSGGLKGAESAFGEAAEKWGATEVTFTFEGNVIAREKNMTVLSDEELVRGDISMELASKMMHRTYYEKTKIRKVLQTIFHMVNKGHQVFAVGTILEDNTVKGGTGWAVELARLFNRPVSVFDQEKNLWFSWKDGSWQKDSPKIEHKTFVGSGTRYLTDEGKQAIEKLFNDSFGQA